MIGGGGRILPSGNYNEYSVQRAIDLACAQEAQRKLFGQLQACRINDGTGTLKYRRYCSWYYLAKGICRTLSDRFGRPISPKARAFIVRICAPEYVERVTALHINAYVPPPELPKRPPGMK